MLAERLRQKHHNGVDKAIHDGDPTPELSIAERKRTKRCEKSALAVLSAGVVLLALYAILSLF
jgi:hypothetical protein